jgi:hypothetical protein
MKHLWSYWLNEPIYLDNGVTNIVKRKDAVYLFCKEGLIPFIEQKGYRFYMDDTNLYYAMLRVLFALFRKKKVMGHKVEDDYADEQYDFFCYHFDSLEWEHFWDKWGGFQDFQEDAFGHSLRYTLSELLWSWIDLGSSPKAIRLRRELEQEEEYEEITKGKEDPYLVETSKRDYQDRHW